MCTFFFVLTEKPHEIMNGKQNTPFSTAFDNLLYTSINLKKGLIYKSQTDIEFSSNKNLTRYWHQFTL
jgi:hypothetical protein